MWAMLLSLILIWNIHLTKRCMISVALFPNTAMCIPRLGVFAICLLMQFGHAMSKDLNYAIFSAPPPRSTWKKEFIMEDVI